MVVWVLLSDMWDNSISLFKAVFVLIWPQFGEDLALLSSKWRFFGLMTSKKAFILGLGELSHVSDRSTGRGAGPPHLGDGVAALTSGSASELVAGVLPFRTPAWLAASRDARVSRCTRALEAAVPTADPSHGGWANEAAVDHAVPPEVLLASAP